MSQQEFFASDTAAVGGLAAELATLRSQLNQWSHEYYVLGRPSVSDLHYDQAYDRLLSLESAHPDLVTADSPTQRVGSDLSNDFPEFRHTIPVLSLDKAYGSAEILAWVKRCSKELVYAAETGLPNTGKGFACVLEEKLDGLSLVLYYKDGLLERAVTRGNGELGNDVSANVRTIRDVPLRLSRPVSGAFRGEVFLGKQDFDRLNREQEIPYANPRNLAGGTLRRVKSSEVAPIPLRMFVYEGFYEGSPQVHAALLKDLSDLGFAVNQRGRVIAMPEGIAELESWIASETAERRTLAYEIDGLVIKLDSLQDRERLGYTGHHPRWAIAYKFESPQGQTKVISIDVQVGRSGRITPVARVEPVAVGGTTIQNVTLHNQAYIDALELAIGDTVTVSRRGDVIPAVESVVEKGDGLIWRVPTDCPACHQALQANGAHHFCQNFDCPDRQLGRMRFFVARDQMDIDGLGAETVDFLWKEGIVHDLPDLFRLPYAKIIQYPGFGDKKVARLEKSIEIAKQRPFSQIMVSLGLPDFGPKLIQLFLDNGYRSMAALYHLVETTTPEDIQGAKASRGIKGIGPKTAQIIWQELANPRLRQLVSELEQCGLNFTQPETESSATDPALQQLFAGQTWCVTGTFEHFKPRSLAMAEILKRGGRETDSVTKETSHLLVGADAGSKLEKANKLGTVIVNEAEFLAMIGT